MLIAEFVIQQIINNASYHLLINHFLLNSLKFIYNMKNETYGYFNFK